MAREATAPAIPTKTQAYLLKTIEGLASLAEDPLSSIAEIDEFINAGHIALKTYRKLLVTRLNRAEQEA